MAFTTERIDLRREKRTVWQDDADPRLKRAVLSLHDQWYQDDGGLWQAVREEWATDGADGFDLGCATTRSRTRVKYLTAGYRWHPRRGRPLEYLDVDLAQWFGGTPARWRALPVGTRTRPDARTVRFESTNHAQQLEIGWRGVKQLYVLLSPLAAHRVRYPVQFVGLTFDQATGALTAQSDGVLVGYLPRFVCIDALGQDVPLVSQVWTGTHFEIEVGVGIYPLTLDPSPYISQPDETASKDTWIIDSSPTQSNGTSNVLSIGENAAAVSIRRGLVQFPVDDGTIPAGSTVTSATLELVPVLDAASQGDTLKVFRVIRSGWTEAGATWNTYDGTNNWGTAGCANTTSDREATAIDDGTATFTGTQTLNVAIPIPLDPAKIQEMISGGSFANNGFLVKTENEADDLYNYGSSNHATSGNRPKLTVNYTEPGGTAIKDLVGGFGIIPFAR